MMCLDGLLIKKVAVVIRNIKQVIVKNKIKIPGIEIPITLPAAKIRGFLLMGTPAILDIAPNKNTTVILSGIYNNIIDHCKIQTSPLKYTSAHILFKNRKSGRGVLRFQNKLFYYLRLFLHNRLKIILTMVKTNQPVTVPITFRKISSTSKIRCAYSYCSPSMKKLVRAPDRNKTKKWRLFRHSNGNKSPNGKNSRILPTTFSNISRKFPLSIINRMLLNKSKLTERPYV